jgi:hypothetical protein
MTKDKGQMTNRNVKKSCRFSSKMLHLFTETIATEITQHLSFVNNSGAFSPSPYLFILPTQQQINQPMAGFCFQTFFIK